MAVVGIVSCSIERLYDWEDPGYVVPGVTLSVSWQGTPDKLPPNFCLPWQWLGWNTGPEALSFQLAAVQIDSNSKAVFGKPQTPVNPQPLSWNNSTIAVRRQTKTAYQGFAGVLNGQFNAIQKADFSRLAFPGDPSAKITVGSQTLPAYATAPWPSVLADLSTRPAPIPQVLLLSFILPKVAIADLLPKDAKPEEWRLMAAPTIPAAAVGGSADIALGTAATFEGDKITVDWPYLDSSYLAKSESVSLGPPPTHSFFDMNSRLVISPGDQAWHNDQDWQASMESRLGNALDFGAELLSQIPTASPSLARVLADAVIASLRDIAGIGVDTQPSGLSLLDALAGRSDNALSKAVSGLVSSNTTFTTVAGWKAFLSNGDPQQPQGVFGGTSGSALYDPNIARFAIWGSDPIAPPDAVSQLHQLRQKILTPNLLWAFLLKQIDVIVSGVTDPQLKAALQSLTAPTDLTTLPAALRAENLGRYWPAVRASLAGVKGTDGTPGLQVALATALETAAALRFDPTRTPPGLPKLEAYADVEAAMHSASAKADWGTISQQAIPAQAAPPNTGTGLAPQGITVQVNELDSPTSAPSSGEVALVKKLQGVAMLLAYDNGGPKESKYSGWKCLNYADAYYSSTDAGGNLQTSLLEQSVVVAGRFTYQNQIAMSTLTFNNEPLCAPGPLSCGANLVYSQSGTANSAVASANDVVWYRYADTGSGKDISLTPLTFGRNYRPQPFLIGASGALPKALTDGALYLDLGTKLDTASALVNTTWKQINYRRISQVSNLRLSGAVDRRDIAFPAIPAGVAPFTQTSDSGQPLLMLVPDDSITYNKELPSTFSLAVRPPATDVLTWDRFVNGFQNGLAARRADVLNTFMNQAMSNNSPTPANPLPDMTVDDPATVVSTQNGDLVTYDCRFFAEMLGQDGSPIGAGQLIPFPAPSGTGLSSMQAGPVFFDIKVGASTGMGLVSANRVPVTVTEGQQAILKLSVCVPDGNRSRFAVQLPAADSSSYIHLAPINLYIEVASAKMPAPADILAAFDVGSYITVNGNQTFVKGVFNSLDGIANANLDLSNVTNHEYVQSAEVLRQVWKWQGRPVHPILPDSTGKSEWLVREFGSRTDYMRTPMPPSIDPAKYSFIEDLSSILTATQRGGAKLAPSNGKMSPPSDLQLRGTYIRYAAQVQSRYAPLLVQNVVPTPPDTWVDLYIPSRKLTGLQQPDVKLILPLTRNASAPGKGPGILVLLRGPWFQTCGLGETLEARVIMVEAPEDVPGGQTQTFYYQYGPDPTISLKSSAKTHTFPSGTTLPEISWGGITGPVGHSFDTVSDDQLFINTSFVLDYPNVDGLPWTPWAFCQLQLRRAVFTLDPNGKQIRAAVSDWTAPAWVQLLPDFDLYGSTPAPLDGLQLSLGANNTVQLVDKSGSVLPAPPSPVSPSAMFAEYMAVSHFIMDVTGVPTQEAYDGLYRPVPGSGTWQAIGKSTALKNNGANQPPVFYRGRIVTVQGRPTAGTLPSFTDDNSFWQAMFSSEKNGSDIDRLRIVAVSRPIDMPNTPYLHC